MCTKNVLKGQWYMEKMKMKDVQLTQSSVVTTSTIDDWSNMMGATPATNSSSIQSATSQGSNRPSWQGLQIHKSGTIYTHSYAQTNKQMYNWILLNTCSLINHFLIDPLCEMCTKSTLCYHLQQMQE